MNAEMLPTGYERDKAGFEAEQVGLDIDAESTEALRETALTLLQQAEYRLMMTRPRTTEHFDEVLALRKIVEDLPPKQ